MTQRIYWNEDWFFSKSFSNDMLSASFDTTHLERVRLPHTVCETPYNYFDESIYQMKSAYIKTFMADMSWKDHPTLLTFEGAAHFATVYLNGKQIGTHACGYTAFTLDLSNYLDFGKINVLVIALDSTETLNQPPFGNVIDYMTYGGLYREVYLDIKSPYYIADTFVSTSNTLQSEHTSQDHNAYKNTPQKKTFLESILHIELTLNQSEKDLKLHHYLTAPNQYIPFEDIPLHTSTEKINHQVSSITLWDIHQPFLYTLHLELMKGDTVIDTKEVRFGFRDVQFKSDGFYLNGEKLLLRGLNRHQSYPYVGYAMPKSPQIYDADLLKYELGLNAVRTSHYPQSQYFIDRCDEIGLLVFTEMPGWQHIGDRDWQEVALHNIEEMILQYRNHPSIILWGVRINESPDHDAFYQRTNELAHRLDPSRATGGVRCIKNSHLLEDVYTYNDFSHEGDNAGLEKRKAIFPEKQQAYLVSEYNGHMYPTKSFDHESRRLSHALRHANVLESAQTISNLSGTFGWCMFDYNTHKDFGSGDRICYHGVMDMFRNPKLASAVYSSFREDETILEISSTMDVGEHPGSFMGDIYIFTNADSVRLYKNDVFIKEYTVKSSPYSHLPHGPILVDDLIGNQLEVNEGYSKKVADAIKELLMAASRFGLTHLPLKAKLTALRLMLFHSMKMDDGIRLYNKYIGNWGNVSTSYRFEAIKNNQVVKTVIKQPFSKIKLVAIADHNVLHETTTYDVACIRIRATDENGNILPFYQEPINLSLTGTAALIGPDIISLKGGMGGTYIKTIGETGTASLTLSGNGISPITLSFTIDSI